jgi:hypothetical protein
MPHFVSDLCRAASLGDKESVKYILTRYDLDVNCSNTCGVTMQSHDCRHNWRGKGGWQSYCCKGLTLMWTWLKGKATLRSCCMASCSGHLNVVESLLQRKDVDVNRGVDDGKGRTAQMQAARYGLVFDSTSRIVDKSTIFFRLSRSRLIFG